MDSGDRLVVGPFESEVGKKRDNFVGHFVETEEGEEKKQVGREGKKSE